MIDSKYRGKYQRVVIDPLLKSPLIQRLNPIAITWCGLIAGLMVPLFLFLQLSLYALCFLVLSGFFDTLDGSIARSVQKTSNRGAVLDITFDRIVEVAVIMGLFLFDPLGRGLSCLLLLGSSLICITTFLVVGIFSENTSEKGFHYSPGIMERAEAFLLFGAMILFPEAFFALSLLYSILVFYTGVKRLYDFINFS